MDLVAAWEALVGSLAAAFTEPGFETVFALVRAWALVAGRHTLSRMFLVGGERSDRRGYDHFTYLVRQGAWRPDKWWPLLASALVRRLVPSGRVSLIVDDTLEKKVGEHVAGAGMFRDAVHSTKKHVITAWGLNVVVVAVLVRLPVTGKPLALPLWIRLHTKGGPTLVEIAAAMLGEIAALLPGRPIDVIADGAYAALARRLPEGATLTSRMRKSAAIYEPAPPRTGRRGRPRKRGERLPTPEALARALPVESFQGVDLMFRTRPVRRMLYCRPVLWYAALKEQLVLLVVVRDPDGNQPDDFFFTTDLSLGAQAVAERFANRWPIEETFRESKQILGLEDPQSWTHAAPERALALGFGLYSLVLTWFLTTPGTQVQAPDRPWYPNKSSVSFLDALAALRRALWPGRISARSLPGRPSPDIPEHLIELLAYAA